MNATPVQIPGFYYDREKQKYFKLLPHHAAPSAAFYSTSSVRKQERERAMAEADRKEATRLLNIKRHSVLKSDPYIRATLLRELAVQSSHEKTKEDLRQLYASSLKRRHVFPAGGKISAFTTEFSEYSKRLIVGTSEGLVRDIPIVEDECGNLQQDCINSRHLMCSSLQITSISISTRRLLLATFLHKHQNSSIYMKRLHDTSSTSDEDSQIALNYSHPAKSLWTSTASPHPDGAMLIGSSDSAVYVTDHPHDINQQHYRTKSDVFAVEFHTVNHFMFFCGSRDGGMRLFDIRTPRTEERANIVVRHGSTITHITALDEVNVLVNGLQGAAMYDTRFPHPAAPSSRFAEPTRAARHYSQLERNNGYMIDQSFHVDKSRGMMAVANQENYVNLYSVATGDKLHDCDISKKKLDSPCKGLKFENDTEREGLWVVDREVLEWYSF